MEFDPEFYELAYFSLDKPVPYELKSGQTIEIKPIMTEDAMLFLASADILRIDKNSAGSVEAIQMAYLTYLQKVVLPGQPIATQKLINVLNLCIGLKDTYLCTDEKKRAFLKSGDIEITAKEFDEIKRIILYQNIVGYDDTYINPELKKAMDEVDKLRNIGYDMPSFERKVGIIEAHTGISSDVLMKKTWRRFQILFNEVCGEIEFLTTRTALIACGAGDKIEHYIFKKKKNKFDGYFLDPGEYNKSMGGKGISSIKTVMGEGVSAQFENLIPNN